MKFKFILFAILIYFLFSFFSIYKQIKNYINDRVLSQGFELSISNIETEFLKYYAREIYSLKDKIKTKYDKLEYEISINQIIRTDKILKCMKQNNTRTKKCLAGKGVLKNSRSEFYMNKPYNISDLIMYYPAYYPVILDSNLCGDSDIVQGIHVGPNQFNYRTVLRNTWGKVKKILGYKIKTFFFMGIDYKNKTEQSLLIEENKKYHDVIQFDYQTTYINLTIDIILSYNWTLYNCKKIKYFIKSDGDLYPNLEYVIHDNLVPVNESAIPRTSLGRIIGKGRAIRDPYHKNAIFKELYPDKYFKPYLSGCFYIHPKDVLKIVLFI